MVTVLALINTERIDRQTVFVFDQARGLFGGFLVRVTNFLFVIYPAFFGLVGLRFHICNYATVIDKGETLTINGFMLKYFEIVTTIESF